MDSRISSIYLLIVQSAFQCDVTPQQCSKKAFSNSESIREKMEISLGCIIYTKNPAFFMLGSAFCPDYARTHAKTKKHILYGYDVR